MLKAAKEKRLVTYTGKPIRISANFSAHSKSIKVMKRYISGSER
jgi:hypothetical protein